MRDDDAMVVGPVTVRTAAEVQALCDDAWALRMIVGLHDDAAHGLCDACRILAAWRAEPFRVPHRAESQAQRSAPSPAPEPCAAWIA